MDYFVESAANLTDYEINRIVRKYSDRFDPVGLCRVGSKVAIMFKRRCSPSPTPSSDLPA